MRFKTGLVVGLAVGYYFGTQAGEEQRERLQLMLDRVRDTDAYRQARDRFGGVVQDGADLARRSVDDLTATAADRATDRIDDLAATLGDTDVFDTADGTG